MAETEGLEQISVQDIIGEDTEGDVTITQISFDDVLAAVENVEKAESEEQD